jgi:hypothetical protein
MGFQSVEVKASRHCTQALARCRKKDAASRAQDDGAVRDRLRPMRLAG